MAHAQLQCPQQQRVQTPADQLRLGSTHSKRVLVRLGRERFALLICHAIVGKAHPPGADNICCRRFEGVYNLECDQPSSKGGYLNTNSSNGHQIVIELEALDPYRSRARNDPECDDGNAHAKQGERLSCEGVSHLAAGSRSTTIEGKRSGSSLRQGTVAHNLNERLIGAQREKQKHGERWSRLQDSKVSQWHHTLTESRVDHPCLVAFILCAETVTELSSRCSHVHEKWRQTLPCHIQPRRGLNSKTKAIPRARQTRGTKRGEVGNRVR